ncbi:MAG TPA: hypothetical protein VFV58_30835 [Blastocatellia bacterium]|jgi:hypothetical protein|nr:hypothetical protein [Blastocatellia bacterium]
MTVAATIVFDLFAKIFASVLLYIALDRVFRTRGLGPKPEETKAENGAGVAPRSPEQKTDVATPTPRL